MLEEIKAELLENPQILKEVVEHFGYCSVVIHNTYMSFGRDELSSKKSIVIRLKDNKFLYVHDYPRNIQQDLFRYIMEQRNVEFSDVIGVVKSTLNISDYYDFFVKDVSIFGGFYKNIRSKSEYKINVYDDEILNIYQECGNIRFLQDNISLETQKYFGIRYDIESQGIVIPIRDQIGQLMGVKVRANWEVSKDELKYFYLVPCAMSQTLFGYSQNYKYLENNVIYVFEAEKSVMQCHSYGIYNCVSLGSGSISKKQVQMLLELNPKKIVFIHDVGFKLKGILRNISMVQAYSRFSEFDVGYWDFSIGNYKDKVSASDLGKNELVRIIDNEITVIDKEIYEELQSKERLSWDV